MQLQTTIGTLRINDSGATDVAIKPLESDCLLNCGATTDHVSGVCDTCSEASDEMPEITESLVA
jgi:hypothetical protein